MQVLVSVGDVVAAGDTVVTVSAMKMEVKVTAPGAGNWRVSSLHVPSGDRVVEGALLVTLEQQE